LTAYTGEFLQIFHRLRHHTVKIANQFLGHTDQVFSLVIRITYTTYIRKYFVGVAGGKAFCIGKSIEQCRGHLVNTLIRALGRQYDCHKQLIRIPVIQFGLGVWAVRREIRHKSLVAFFFKHVALFYINGVRCVREYEVISLMIPDCGWWSRASSSSLSIS